MPQTPPEISDARGVTTAQTQGDSGVDPLLKLHRMSTTAGVGSGEYVAVNGASIAALILGIASFLAVFSAALLIIPALAVIVAIIAFRQIGQSNGTQTGRLLATAGLIAAVGIGGWVGFQEVSGSRRDAADRVAIEQIISELGQDVRDGKPGEAYDRLGTKFKEQVPRDLFIMYMNSARSNQRFGTLQAITSVYDPSKPGLVKFETNPATGERTAVASGMMKFDKVDQPMRQPMLFRQVDGQWELEAMPELFPKTRPADGRGPQGPPGANGAPPAGVQGPPMP
jgi:hypothetical protein